MLQKAKMGVVVFLAVSAMVGVTGVRAFQLLRAEAPASQAKGEERTPVVRRQGTEPAKKPTLTDQYGDALPEGAVARLGTVRLRHNSQIWGVAFSPDGKMLASIAMDEAIRLWDSGTGQPVRALLIPQREPTHSIAFSPDSSKLASGGATLGNVRLWDLGTGKILFEKKGHDAGNGAGIGAMAFSPDGLSFASAGGCVSTWNTATGAERFNLKPAEGNVGGFEAVTYSRDGKLLAAASRKDIHVWDAKSGAPRLVIANAFTRPEGGIVFYDNNTLISSSWDQVGFWDMTTGKQVRQLEPGDGDGRGITLSSNGQLMARAYTDKIVVLDTKTGKVARLISSYQNRNGNAANHLAFSPDAKTLAARGENNAIWMWDLTTGKRRFEFDDSHIAPIESAVFSPDGRHALTASWDGTTRFWDAVTGKHLRLYNLNNSVRNSTVAGFSSDGKWIAAGGDDSDKKRLVSACRVWDAATGKERRSEDFPPHLECLAFSPQGNRLAITTGNTGAYDTDEALNVIYFWDFAKGKELTKVTEQIGRCYKVAFSDHGRTLAWVEGKALRLFRIAAKKHQAPFALPARTYSADISVDGKMAVTTENRGEHLFILEVVTGHVVRTIKAKNTLLNVVALSPDGRFLASCQPMLVMTIRDFDYAIHIWDLETGKDVLRLEPGASAVTSLAFSANGRSLISGMSNGTALIWKLPIIKPRSILTVSSKDLERLWADLGDENAAKAHQAIWTLVASAKQSVPFLRTTLRPVVLADQAQIQKWITDLDSEKFAMRRAAAKELEKVGEQVEPPIEKAMQGNLSLERHRRLEQILNSLPDVPGPKTLRTIRAIMVLERIGTIEAKDVLESLAHGAPGARETEEAKASLQRLTNRLHKP